MSLKDIRVVPALLGIAWCVVGSVCLLAERFPALYSADGLESLAETDAHWGENGNPATWGTAIHNPDLLPGAKMYFGNRRKPTAPPDALICSTCPTAMTMRQMADASLEATPSGRHRNFGRASPVVEAPHPTRYTAGNKDVRWLTPEHHMDEVARPPPSLAEVDYGRNQHMKVVRSRFGHRDASRLSARVRVLHARQAKRILRDAHRLKQQNLPMLAIAQESVSRGSPIRISRSDAEGVSVLQRPAYRAVKPSKRNTKHETAKMVAAVLSQQSSTAEKKSALLHRFSVDQQAMLRHLKRTMKEVRKSPGSQKKTVF